MSAKVEVPFSGLTNAEMFAEPAPVSSIFPFSEESICCALLMLLIFSIYVIKSRLGSLCLPCPIQPKQTSLLTLHNKDGDLAQYLKVLRMFCCKLLSIFRAEQWIFRRSDLKIQPVPRSVFDLPHYNPNPSQHNATISNLIAILF
jgi:hypothetical protein